MGNGAVPLSKIGVSQPLTRLLLLVGQAARIEWNCLYKSGTGPPEVPLHPVPDQGSHPVIFDLGITEMQNPGMAVISRRDLFQVSEKRVKQG